MTPSPQPKPPPDFTAEALSKVDEIVERLEVVQTGWADGAFLEGHIQITVDGVYELPTDVREQILEHQKDKWIEDGFRDNVQLGVRKLSIIRETDEPIRDIAHRIVITAHAFRYLESKATNFEWLAGSSQNVLGKYFSDATQDHHAHAMPTPLSVGLSLFCEGGRKLVLVRRTKNKAAGGHIAGGKITNAVGENCAPIDCESSRGDKVHLSVFRTAARGLLEEMGLDRSQISVSLLHTLCWDKKMCDYKFFGLAISPLSDREVEYFWDRAPDKGESAKFKTGRLMVLDVETRAAATGVVADILRNKDEWSFEARQSTIMSLLQMHRINKDDLVAAAQAYDLKDKKESLTPSVGS